MITPTRELLEAALAGYEIQRKAIEMRQDEIRNALKSPVEVMVEEAEAAYEKANGGDLKSGLYLAGERDPMFGAAVQNTAPHPKRTMTAAGRAAISRATKARWAKYRKEQKRGGK